MNEPFSAGGLLARAGGVAASGRISPAAQAVAANALVMRARRCCMQFSFRDLELGSDFQEAGAGRDGCTYYCRHWAEEAKGKFDAGGSGQSLVG